MSRELDWIGAAAEFEEHCEELQKRLNLLSDRLSEHAVFLDTVSALKNQIDLDKVRHVVCFGVGSPHLRFRVDGAQCAFALALSKACNDARIHYFDPASDKVDAHVLQAMGVFLLSNTHCVLDVVSAFDLHQDERVLLFMPHCNAPMYHNVLCSNWSHLNRIILLGNPLTRYLSDSSSHVAARSAGGISGPTEAMERLQTTTRTTHISDSFHTPGVFNELALSTFGDTPDPSRKPPALYDPASDDVPLIL